LWTDNPPGCDTCSPALVVEHDRDGKHVHAAHAAAGPNAAPTADVEADNT